MYKGARSSIVSASCEPGTRVSICPSVKQYSEIRAFCMTGIRPKSLHDRQQLHRGHIVSWSVEGFKPRRRCRSFLRSSAAALLSRARPAFVGGLLRTPPEQAGGERPMLLPYWAHDPSHEGGLKGGLKGGFKGGLWGAFGSKKNRKLESDVMFVSATTRKWTGRRCRFVLAQFVETRQLVPNWEDSWKIMQFQYGPIIYNCIAGVHKVEAQVFHNDVQSCDFKWPVTDLELQSLSDQLWLLAATIRSAVGNPFRKLPTRRTLKVKVPVLL